MIGRGFDVAVAVAFGKPHAEGLLHAANAVARLADRRAGVAHGALVRRLFAAVLRLVKASLDRFHGIKAQAANRAHRAERGAGGTCCDGTMGIAAAVPQVVRAARELTAKGTASEPASGGEGKKLQQRADDLGRQIDDLAQKRDALKDKLDAISQQANQNQWLLSIVLAVAGLLTLAQGAFAFFSAQNYAKQADDAVKKIEARAAEASARFPLLEGTERANDRAFKRLTEIKKQLNLDQNLYKRLDADSHHATGDAIARKLRRDAVSGFRRPREGGHRPSPTAR
jgi:ATP-dependent protease HslVU (ClpYQ) peptidase subunit